MTEPETPQTPPPPPPETSTPTQGGDSGNRGLMIALSYLWLLALVPLLVEKDDAEVQWHAKHGLVLMIAEIAIGLLLGILGAIPVIGCVAWIASVIFMFGVVALHIICIVKGVGGERFLIPGISQYADKF